MPDLIGYDEIAALLGVKPATVRVWHNDRHLLPDPVVPGSAARRPHNPQWDHDAIMRWAQNSGRLTDEYRAAVKRYRDRIAGITVPPGGETGFEREMRLAREADRI